MKKLTPRVLPKRNELHRSSVSNEGLVHGDIDEDTQVLEQKLRNELQNSSDVCFRRFGVERGRTSFTIPRYNFGFSYRLLRFFVSLLSAIVGLYGLVISFIVILIHQVNLESFGVPYMSLVAPRNLKQLRDIFTRVPRKYLSDRPQSHMDQPSSARQHSSRLSRS